MNSLHFNVITLWLPCLNRCMNQYPIKVRLLFYHCSSKGSESNIAIVKCYSPDLRQRGWSSLAKAESCAVVWDWLDGCQLDWFIPKARKTGLSHGHSSQVLIMFVHTSFLSVDNSRKNVGCGWGLRFQKTPGQASIVPSFAAMWKCKLTEPHHLIYPLLKWGFWTNSPSSNPIYVNIRNTDIK